MASDRITILGRSYLRGRKLHAPALAFLVARDLVLGPFVKARPAPLPKGTDLRHICVCQIDHLGDLLMVAPLLVELRQFAPKARLTLVVGRWCAELAEVLRAGGWVDECLVYTAWPLDSGARRLPAKMYDSFQSLISSARALRATPLDVFFDLRPWSPNAWMLAALSRATVRVGYGLRGMAAVYNCRPPYSADKSTGQAHLDALQVLTGKPRAFAGPRLPPVPCPGRLALPAAGYVVAQLFSREATRNVPADLWREILQRVGRRIPVVLVGAPIDAQRAGALVEVPGVVSLLGKTTIPEMLGVIQQCAGVISIDSFAAHVGLAYAKKVAVLMVDAISNHRSFPENNPGLKFVPATAGAGEIVDEFLKGARA